MKIVEVTRFGGPEVLVAGRAPGHEAGPGQVVIAVSVVDVMSIDAQLRAGWGREWFPARPPYVPGTGVAGRVVSVGDGVEGGWAGRRVAALLPNGGAYAERAVAGVETVVAVPDEVPLWQAAALVQVGPAALSLVEAAELRPGTRVLVTGAGGALGLALVRLASAAGALVTAAAHGPAKREAALAAGAAQAADYAEPAEPAAGAFEVVFDGVGGEVGAAAFARTASGGRFFAYGVPSGSTATIAPAEAGRRKVRVIGMEQVQFAPDEFTRLAEQALKEAAAGRLATPVGLVVPLERAAEAHAALEARELVGKALLLATAQAVRYGRHGGPEVLELTEIPLPEPGPGQVRVAVRAAGVNPIDWKMRQGLRGAPPDGPQGTGMELAGTVDALGEGVTGLRLGDPVYGQVAPGALATHAIADADALAYKPDDLTYEEAAALPVAVETARRALRDLALQEGETLLIHAVAGGVGLAAAQLALARGATVIGTASGRHHEFLRGLGVRPVEYGDGLERRLPESVDRVLDASGRGELDLSVKLTGDPARVITIADRAGAERLGVRFSTGDGAAAAARALRESPHVRLPVAEVFPLEQATQAHRRSEQGHFLGKLVVNTEASLPR
ncbi:NADPH:quinone reductase-like Zn-dependent oxidoreductase [Nonomuraea rubra]|uniref:NADPH:quinone reductase-like Zn-dependent oxidoreductase n=1 Tax=Nonomuraea rubra TaxID=46180 RepID=A0A7X0NQS5_9ACTN|nr:zinc-binding dehydrogenase [Nonomuraea rubra]MBB6547915.1 NADPH:quinone reductase-like Zn-dependent oxidoreductase [Nonomuraea rubra]